MRDWDADEDEPGFWGWVEFIALGAMVAYAYLALVHGLFMRVLAWLAGGGAG